MTYGCSATLARTLDKNAQLWTSHYVGDNMCSTSQELRTCLAFATEQYALAVELGYPLSEVRYWSNEQERLIKAIYDYKRSPEFLRANRAS